MAMILPGHRDKLAVIGPWLETYRNQHYLTIRVGHTDIRFLLNEADGLINGMVEGLEEARGRGLWNKASSR